MMNLKCLVVVAVLTCLALTSAAPRVPQHGLLHQIQRGVAGPNPYIFLTVPKGRSQSLLQAFEVIEEDSADDDDDDDNDGDDEKKSHALKEETVDEEEEENEDVDAGDMENDNDDNEEDEEDKDSLDQASLAVETEEDDDDELDNVMKVNLKLRKITQAKRTQMMVSREHAGTILVPDEIIEIEAESVIDESTGKPALLLPRAVLNSIPDGSVVALIERSGDDEEAEERANRVIVRRRRKDARRNISRRRRGNKRRINRRGGNQRRRVNKRRNVRIIRRGVNLRGNNKRRVNRRRVNVQS